MGGIPERQTPRRQNVIPGVLDSTTNYTKHPQLVGQRIIRYAEVVAKENVIAGSDMLQGFRCQLIDDDSAMVNAG